MKTAGDLEEVVEEQNLVKSNSWEAEKGASSDKGGNGADKEVKPASSVVGEE